jgi:hypothetical protein
MPRERQHQAEAAEVALADAMGVVLAPTGVYSLVEVRRMLRLRESSLRREIREGRLSVCKRCGRYYFLGSQLLDWLRAGVIDRRPGRNGSS